MNLGAWLFRLFGLDQFVSGSIHRTFEGWHQSDLFLLNLIHEDQPLLSWIQISWRLAN